MGWKFWEKKTSPASLADMQFPTDSYDSVRFLAGMFLKMDVVPFTLWRSPKAQLRPEVESVANFATRGLMLCTWFWLFENKHGALAVRMVRDEFRMIQDDVDGSLGGMTDSLMGIVERAWEAYANADESKRSIVVGDKTVELPFHYWLAVAALTQMEDSPHLGKDGELGTDDMDVMECLEYGSERAKAVWEQMLGSIAPFNPASFPRWKWSAKPGARERHLQRRHNNPLFEVSRRSVNAAEVYYARVMDAQALQDVRRDFKAIFEEIQTGDLDFDWHKQLDGLRTRLDALKERLNVIGGEKADLLQAIAALREHVLATWRAALGDAPEKLALLQEAQALEAQREALWTEWSSQATGDSSSVPKDEVAVALLCEPVEDIKKAVAVLGASTGAASLRTVALQSVMRALAENQEVPQHREKLAVLGVVI
jgi:hypothetical protein